MPESQIRRIKSWKEVDKMINTRHAPLTDWKNRSALYALRPVCPKSTTVQQSSLIGGWAVNWIAIRNAYTYVRAISRDWPCGKSWASIIARPARKRERVGVRSLRGDTCNTLTRRVTIARRWPSRSYGQLRTHNKSIANSYSPWHVRRALHST